MKSTLSRNTKLVLGGELFHVRCCAHILNLLVQHDPTQIKDIIENVRESVKYVNHSDSRLKTFCDIVKQMGIKQRKLVIDCPTRWNSTYEMLNIASRFKDFFREYKERDRHYNCLSSTEEWEKVDKVCHLLKVLSYDTNIISGSDYPTTNLYLPKVYMVKVVIDKAAEDSFDFMRGMTRFMKDKFDKYWGECNLLMAIANVLDPRCKLEMVSLCFPFIYKSEFDAKVNIEKVRQALEDIYNDYLQESSSNIDVRTRVEGSSSSTPSTEVSHNFESGFAQLMSMNMQGNLLIQLSHN
ncbi:zinc finger BED domain-containing protein RICESLEEPER 2-like [Gastrolobium bilobum]|uniref:zinc finger BED domain-containing protein RICESLEEPER 2-like n=1 Tax=Gastrolobium bilobum TaxID=150636 RepID=UPI002AB1DBB5|nr:zinc finger BED domain-containing protein RICESLEEPER 2-like [Gastrolobium bilobum]